MQGDLGKTVSVFRRMHGRVHVSGVGTAECMFWAHGSVGRGARLGRDACAHGRVHGLVAHGLNFMGYD